MADVKKTAKIGEGRPGPGRPKGVPNKTTTLLKDAILKAAEEAGNKITESVDENGEVVPGNEGLVGYLKFVAVDNPGAFTSLLGKVLPLQVTGEGGGPLKITVRIGGDDADG